MGGFFFGGAGKERAEERDCGVLRKETDGGNTKRAQRVVDAHDST